MAAAGIHADLGGCFSSRWIWWTAGVGSGPAASRRGGSSGRWRIWPRRAAKQPSWWALSADLDRPVRGDGVGRTVRVSRALVVREAASYLWPRPWWLWANRCSRRSGSGGLLLMHFARLAESGWIG